ncbi:hypothetical protein J6590_064905 [Homalodisca vitripennis]|nr:hypothetical protein J6590_064905 [Homalodisca vitripennis]
MPAGVKNARFFGNFFEGLKMKILTFRDFPGGYTWKAICVPNFKSLTHLEVVRDTCREKVALRSTHHYRELDRSTSFSYFVVAGCNLFPSYLKEDKNSEQKNLVSANVLLEIKI